jgi:hypothetical protein
MKANLYLEQSMQEEQMRETSNADWPAWEAGDANTELDSKYKAVRSVTRSLAARLSAEDQIVQSCPEASPVKWHQAHTTWFFETFVLRQFLTDYQPFREEFSWLFNSYYNSLGEEIPEKKLRALSRVPRSMRSSPSVCMLTKRSRDCLQAKLMRKPRGASYWACTTSNSTKN